MKKILLIIGSIAILSCSKQQPAAPTTTTVNTTTTPTVIRYHYTWSFHKNGNTVYTYGGSACYTVQEMAAEQQLSGAFNIQKGTPC